MVDFTKKVQKHAQGFEAGEQVITAGVVSPRGSTMRNAVSGGIGGVVGVGVAAAMDKKRAAEDAGGDITGGIAASFPQQKVFLTVTDRRLVLHSFGTMTGRPKDLITSLPRQQIAQCSVEAGKLVSAMTLQFSDGSAVTVDLLKGGGDPRRFAAALGFTAA